MSTDWPVDIRSTDLGVATELLADLEESQRRLTNSLERQRQRITELRDVLNEWRTRRI
jgi:hypothetical protein